MKNTKWILLLTMLYSTAFITGCDDDPEPVNEEELITTLSLRFQHPGGTILAEFLFRDLDGDGGIAPVVINDTLEDSTAYIVTVRVLNESVTPAIDITEEIIEEGAEHQVFFQTFAGLDFIDYLDYDGNGYPIGLFATFFTVDTGSGQLTVTLRHEPNKEAAGVEDGDITNAGGETDLEVTFDVVVQ